MSPVAKPESTQEAKEILQQKPLVVLFYMIGCPHCEANKPAWDKFKKTCKVPVAEIESNETPEDSGVQGFPTMMYIKEGGERTVISGRRSSAKDIARELGVPTSKGRRLRRRTSRNYVPLVKKLTRRR